MSAFDDGASAEEIAARFPSLVLRDVYATITYLLQHRPEVDRYLESRTALDREHREEAARRFPGDGLRERLIRRDHDPAGC